MFEADYLPISITCPVCGEKHDGNADEIFEWRAQHKCPRPSADVIAMPRDDQRTG